MWLFHCHPLYHLHSGMARVFSYKEKGPDHQPQLGEHAHDLLYFMIDSSLRNHMSMGTITLMSSRNDWFAMWGVGFYDDPAIMGGMHHENDDTEYDTGSEWEWTVGADYLLTKPFSLITQYHSEHRFSRGFIFRF